jgi:hypothetical protein
MADTKWPDNLAIATEFKVDKDGEDAKEKRGAKFELALSYGT